MKNLFSCTLLNIVKGVIENEEELIELLEIKNDDIFIYDNFDIIDKYTEVLKIMDFYKKEVLFNSRVYFIKKNYAILWKDNDSILNKSLVYFLFENNLAEISLLNKLIYIDYEKVESSFIKNKEKMNGIIDSILEE